MFYWDKNIQFFLIDVINNFNFINYTIDKMFIISVAIFIILVIITVLLLIFAPKKQKFFIDVFDSLKNDNNFNNCLTKLLFIGDCFHDAEKMNKPKIEKNMWESHPDKKLWGSDPGLTDQSYLIFPLYTLNNLNVEFLKKCKNISRFVNNIPNVKSAFIAKIAPETTLTQHSTWKTLSNSTLRCIFPIKAGKDIDYCGVWVDGESKNFKKDDWVIFDHSLNWNIYNKNDTECILLVLDIVRPNFIAFGTSETPDYIN
jgi:hypothetical protein